MAIVICRRRHWAILSNIILDNYKKYLDFKFIVSNLDSATSDDTEVGYKP
jgi:hypothetical protein